MYYYPQVEHLDIGLDIFSSGIQMHYVDKGAANAGPYPIIFCHGWPEFWFSWRHQLDALSAAGYRVIAPDLKGFGWSSCPPQKEEYTLSKITEDLVALMDHLRIPKAIFVGHDWGSPAVQAMTLRYPERVAAVASYVVPFYPRQVLLTLYRSHVSKSLPRKGNLKSISYISHLYDLHRHSPDWAI